MENQNAYRHIHRSGQRLLLWYKGKVRQRKIGNMDYQSFLQWYQSTAKVCHYCELTEEESQRLVRQGFIRSKRFPQNGQHGRGTSRGMWLEVDRYDPKKSYEVSNMVLACYFCNNDKSDVFHGDVYKYFVKDRSGFLKQILERGSGLKQ